MNGTIYFRADHELIGRVLAEKLRRRTDRSGRGDGFRIMTSREGQTARAV
jgi:hypothetical protein